MSTVNQNTHDVQVHKLLSYTFYTPEFIVKTASNLGFNPDDAAIAKIQYLQQNYLSAKFFEIYDNTCEFLDIVDIVSKIPIMKNEEASFIAQMLLPIQIQNS